MNNSGKKGVSYAAKAHAREVRRRFVEFVKSKGLSEVSEKSGCNYQALRNSYVDEGGYNPSLETIFQVKLGYGDEFDEVYVFTGKKIKLETLEIQGYMNEITSQPVDDQLAALQEKLKEKDEQIKELKEDKAFLQSIIKKQ